MIRLRHALGLPHGKECDTCHRELVCRHCHSLNVSSHGYYPHNHRHHCHDCGYVEAWYE